MSVSQRRAMIGPDTDLRVSQQCRLLGLSRSTYYYQPAPVTADDLVLLRQMDEQYLKTPHYGARSYATWFQRRGVAVGRKKAARLMAVLGIGSTAPQPKTSAPGRSHPVYPYLLKGMTIERPDQVWAADITYVPLAHGFAYLVVIMDWASRKVLSWRLSNTLDADFCVAALEAALQDYGCPDIVNTDQGAQFTGAAFIDTLKAHDVQISMDDKGCYRDNILVERLWRTVKYEHLYTRTFENVKAVRDSLVQWFDWYNRERFHQSLDNRTPDEVYYACQTFLQAA